MTNEQLLTQDVSTLVSKNRKDFYYLFPGQGRGARKRFVRNLLIGLVAGTFISGLLALLWYFVEK
ncbi:MAG TPA: hypothetical protein VFC44_26115 [Candidatus Saccharimonadales bacterium]|nr:hypothetical protein [Candidatus Saccharimonadales bacterium]